MEETMRFMTCGGLIALALIIPATLIIVERGRSRRAQRAYERSL